MVPRARCCCCAAARAAPAQRAGVCLGGSGGAARRANSIIAHTPIGGRQHLWASARLDILMLFPSRAPPYYGLVPYTIHYGPCFVLFPSPYTPCWPEPLPLPCPRIRNAPLPASSAREYIGLLPTHDFLHTRFLTLLFCPILPCFVVTWNPRAHGGCVELLRRLRPGGSGERRDRRTHSGEDD